MAAAVRALVSQDRNRFQQDGFDLDLTYITPQIIAMGVPGVGIEASFRNPEDEVARFFQQRHKNHFMIYNLAMEKSYDFSKFDDQVISMGWPDHHAPPLQMLFQICQSLSSWLNADPLNVAAVHCKAGKGRTGTVIAAFLLYSGLAKEPAEALSLFSHQRSTDKKSDSVAHVDAFDKGGVTIPSQIKYVHYFHQVLSGFKLSPSKCRLKAVIVSGAINVDGKGGWKPYFKILHENLHEIYSSKQKSGDVTLKSDEPMRLEMTEPLPTLCGDYLFVFKTRGLFASSDLFRFTINTGFCDGAVRITKKDLDDGYKDKRIPDDFFIDMFFDQLPSAGEPDPFGWAQSIIVQQAQSVAQTRSRQSVCEPRASSAVHVTAPLTVPSTQSLVELEAPKIAPPLPPRKPKPLVSKVPAATTTTVSTELP